jgi:hypothetical protein
MGRGQSLIVWAIAEGRAAAGVVDAPSLRPWPGVTHASVATTRPAARAALVNRWSSAMNTLYPAAAIKLTGFNPTELDSQLDLIQSKYMSE